MDMDNVIGDEEALEAHTRDNSWICGSVYFTTASVALLWTTRMPAPPMLLISMPDSQAPGGSSTYVTPERG